ncbi:hypothetical protein BGX38DRAFT_253950 [Terfezia claveryi]|nr:hypothetical protein BGX38DRAFT_253950 [Terfezia claveryi]
MTFASMTFTSITFASMTLPQPCQSEDSPYLHLVASSLCRLKGSLHRFRSSISSQLLHLRPISSPRGQTRACLPVSMCLPDVRNVGSTALSNFTRQDWRFPFPVLQWT